MIKIESLLKIKIYECHKCKHQWASRLPEGLCPRSCPKCNTLRYDMPFREFHGKVSVNGASDKSIAIVKKAIYDGGK